MTPDLTRHFAVTLASGLLLGSLLPGAALWAAPASLPKIEWQASTAQLVQRGGDYGRMARLADHKISCVYDHRGKMWIRHSTDEAKTWQEAILVAEELGCWLTNAELLVLRDGTLLYFWNERPIEAVRNQNRKASLGTLTRPFLIRMSRSPDNGKTWSRPQTLHTAGTAFGDGCWEPAGVQLPSGEVHVYFADESRFTKSDEQEIALVRSTDAGHTWTAPQRVTFRKGHRDGMPAPLLLQNGKGIVVAIEDNGLAGGRFKPAICYTPIHENWRMGAVGGDSANRWAALAEPLPPEWYAGAPCLRQLPSGETLLSFQEGEDGTLNRCRMAVCIGEPQGRNFTNKSYPLPLGPTGNQAWNSLFVKDAKTIVAVMTATVDGVRGIWSVEGKVLRPR